MRTFGTLLQQKFFSIFHRGQAHTESVAAQECMKVLRLGEQCTVVKKSQQLLAVIAVRGFDGLDPLRNNALEIGF
jgi:hypothetical protein